MSKVFVLRSDDGAFEIHQSIVDNSQLIIMPTDGVTLGLNRIVQLRDFLNEFIEEQNVLY